MRAILTGQPHAFRQLVARTEKLVASMLFRMIPVADDRKDIAQDVYLKVHQGLANFKFQSKLSTWIAQIAYNTCLNHLAKKRPILMERFFEQTDDDPAATLNQQQENQTERRLFERELKQTIEKATSQLSPLHQTLISLYYQQEMTLQEIAKITELPEGTIKSYLFRARQQLKTILIRYQKKEEL